MSEVYKLMELATPFRYLRSSEARQRFMPVNRESVPIVSPFALRAIQKKSWK